MLTKVRTLIHEEISLLTVLYFPFRARTPFRPYQLAKCLRGDVIVVGTCDDIVPLRDFLFEGVRLVAVEPQRVLAER